MMNYHDMTTLAQWKGQEAAERLWRAGRETPIVVVRGLPGRGDAAEDGESRNRMIRSRGVPPVRE